MQEGTGEARVSEGSAGPYRLIDGNSSSPIHTVAVENAPFGAFAALFNTSETNNSARLYAPRESVPRITDGIGGPNATVTLVNWVRVSPGHLPEGFVSGVWDEYGVEGGASGARQYAIFLNLGACSPSNGSSYRGGLASHISPVGGPTPGQKYCMTAACDPRPVPPNAWHCLATVYDGEYIRAFVNGTLEGNAWRNPFALTGGIFSPSGLPGRVGAEFGVGANRVNSTPGSPFHWSNYYSGFIGGIAVWDSALDLAGVKQACALGRGF